MPNLPVGSVLEAVLYYKVANQQCMLVRHYQLVNLPSDPSIESIYTLLGDKLVTAPRDIMTALSECMGTHVSIYRASVQAIAPVRYYKLDLPQDVPGAYDSAAPLPPNVAATITLTTLVAGRGRVGSAHIGGMTTSMVTTNSGIQSPYALKLRALGDVLNDGIGGVDPNNYLVPVTYNPLKNPSTNKILSYYVGQFSRTMYRRTVGVGK